MAASDGPGLKRRGPNPRRTRQRDALFEVLKEAQKPLTADELLMRARVRLPGLGVATVYRTLRPLLDDGCVVPVALPDGSTVYELGGRRPHAHFRCSSCGSVFDVDAGPVCVPPGTVLPGGLRVEAWSLTLQGLCANCHHSSE